ncbi:8978_t:CDS:2 [Funneliformis geosporum]|nr:8978_t:CDS:2 [Funneliformis geosporum]
MSMRSSKKLMIENLNDNYNGLSNNEEAAEVETNQNSRPNDLTKMIPSRMLTYDSISNKRTLNNTLSNQIPLRTRDPPSNLSVNRVASSKTHESKSGLKYYTPSNRSVTPSRILSRENSPIDYLSRNKFGFSNRNLRMMSEKLYRNLVFCN